MVVTLVMSAQSPVELTPFKYGADSFVDGKNKSVELALVYAQSIGYTERYRQHDDTTKLMYDTSFSVRRIRSAYNPNNHSSIVLMSDVHNDNVDGEVETLLWVSYYWPKKKTMPKGLPKVVDRSVSDKYGTEYNFTSGKYKNYYIKSIIGNQLKGSGGFNILHTFSAIINGEYVDGSWLE